MSTLNGSVPEAIYHCVEYAREKELAPVLRDVAWTCGTSAYPGYETEIWVDSRHEPQEILAGLRSLGLTVVTDEEASAPWNYDPSKETWDQHVERSLKAIGRI